MMPCGLRKRSGDDIAFAVARRTLGVALVHRRTAAEHDRGHTLLAEVSDVFATPGISPRAIYR